jgi:hypothetical protein
MSRQDIQFIMSATDPTVDTLSQQLAERWNPNATERTEDKGKGKPGTGKAIYNVGLVTPDGTPEVDANRIAEDEKRRAQLEAAEAAKQSPTSQPPEKKDQESSAKTDDDGTDEEAAAQAEVLKEVLSCDPKKPHTVLGIKEDYDNVQDEEKAIETAVYNRGIHVHPKYNKDTKAETAWNST